MLQVGMPAFDPAMLQNLPPMTGGGGGVKITLKNAKISIDKIILSNKE
jgi:CO dehydrogenase/acetyl-CoA synthase beta subunit